MARIAGASRIVVIDIHAKRLEEARRFGATDVIDSTKTLDDLVSKEISLRDVNDGYVALKDCSLTRVVVTSF